MEVVPRLTPTTHRALKLGQLAYAHVREGLSLVMALSSVQDVVKTFCLIPIDGEKSPRLWEDHLGGRTEHMLLINSDWVLEARPDKASQPESSPLLTCPGALVLSEAGPYLLTSEVQHGDALAVNLKTGEIDTPPRRGWPTLDWKIWASEEDRRSPNGRPLFTCNATLPQP